MIGPYAGYATQDDIDRDYDVERSVPDFPAYVSYYLDGSARARAALTCDPAVPYGPTLMEHANIFPATGPRPAPILVFVHGGYWTSLTADVFDLVAAGPVAAGFAVVNVTYALCPRVSITEITRQVRAAIAWTARNAATFGGDPARIFVAGHSAGGHLTAMALLADWEGDYGLPADLIKGAIAISGLFDLNPLTYSFIQPSLRISGDEILSMSPIRCIGPCATPLIVAWGSRETPAFQSQSRNFQQAWSAAGNKGGTLVLDKNHFDILDGFERPDSALTAALLAMG